MSQTEFSGKTVIFDLCKCCRDAGCGSADMPLGEVKVACPECGEPCNCPGCVADATEPQP